MNGRERMMEAIDLQELEKPPVCPPYQGYWALKLAGIGLAESIEHPNRAARAQVVAATKCHFDGYESSWDLFAPVEALGCGVKMLETGTISTTRHIIGSPEDLDRMHLPDPGQDLRSRSSMAAAKDIMALEQGERLLYVTMAAPFTIVGEMRGIEPLLLDTFNDADFVERMLRLAAECTGNYCKEFLKIEPDMVSFTDPTASGALISLEDFRRFSMPSLKVCSDLVRADGKMSMTRIYGNDRLVDSDSIGADVYSLDTSVDVQLACQVMVGALLGNVDPIKTLYLGRAEDVRKDVSRILSHSRKGGFILGAGGDIPPGTPIENIMAMRP